MGFNLSLTYLPGTQRSSRLANRGAVTLSVRTVFPVRSTKHAAATGGGGLDLETGDVLSVEELLYALLLSSSNDASVALAEHAAGRNARPSPR